VGAWLNLVGNLLRLYAATATGLVPEGLDGEEGGVNWRFWLTFGGQCLSACALPFGMVAIFFFVLIFVFFLTF
jgi:hypothetical protein